MIDPMSIVVYNSLKKMTPHTHGLFMNLKLEFAWSSKPTGKHTGRAISRQRNRFSSVKNTHLSTQDSKLIAAARSAQEAELFFPKVFPSLHLRLLICHCVGPLSPLSPWQWLWLPTHLALASLARPGAWHVFNIFRAANMGPLNWQSKKEIDLPALTSRDNF